MTTPVPVLVTGGAGYIGSHAVLALLDAGWPVTVIDNLSTGFRFAIPDAVPFYEGDIADERAARADIRRTGHPRDHAFRRVDHRARIGREPARLLSQQYRQKPRPDRAAAVAAGVPHFIFSSTAATYGMPEVSPVIEDSPTRPINPYGMSKLMTEAMLADTAAAHPLNYCALRYFNVAGADPQARSGPVDRRRDAPDQGRGRGGAGQARPCRGVRHRFRHARRHRACATTST